MLHREEKSYAQPIKALEGVKIKSLLAIVILNKRIAVKNSKNIPFYPTSQV